MSENQSVKPSHPQDKSLVESLGPVATGITMGMGLEAAIGDKNREWTFNRVFSVVAGAVATTLFAVQMVMKEETRKIRQDRGIG